jgi:hypothetical protein
MACLATTLSKSNSEMKTFFFKAFKDLQMSQVPKNPIVIPTGSSPGPEHVLSRDIPKVYSSTLQLLP